MTHVEDPARDDVRTRYRMILECGRALQTVEARGFTDSEARADVAEAFPGWDIVSVFQFTPTWIRVA